MIIEPKPSDLAPGEVITVNGMVMNEELADMAGVEVKYRYGDHIRQMFGKLDN